MPSTGERITLHPLLVAEARRLAELATSAAPLRPHDIERIVRGGGQPVVPRGDPPDGTGHGDDRHLPHSLEAVVGVQIDPLPRWPGDSCATPQCSVAAFGPTSSTRSWGREPERRRRRARRSRSSSNRRPTIGSGSGTRWCGTSPMRACPTGAGGSCRSAAQILHQGGWCLARDGCRPARRSTTPGLGTTRSPGSTASSPATRREAYANPEAGANYVLALDAARRWSDIPGDDRASVLAYLGDVRGTGRRVRRRPRGLPSGDQPAPA